MASALRSAVLRHVRLPVSQALTARGSILSSARWMSSHDDHLSKAEVAERVLDVVKSFPKVDPSKVTHEVHFQKDLGLDSLDNVEIVMALEEEFKLEIPDKEADKIDSCALAIEYISNHPMAVRRRVHDGGELNVGVAIFLIPVSAQRASHVGGGVRVHLVAVINTFPQIVLHFPAFHQTLDVVARVRHVGHDELDARGPDAAQRGALLGRLRLQGGGAEGVVDVRVGLGADFAGLVDQVGLLLLLIGAMDDEWEEGEGK
nr:acyl carrier protein 1, mitochondrial [Ipomoea batatas]